MRPTPSPSCRDSENPPVTFFDGSVGGGVSGADALSSLVAGSITRTGDSSATTTGAGRGTTRGRAGASKRGPRVFDVSRVVAADVGAAGSQSTTTRNGWYMVNTLYLFTPSRSSTTRTVLSGCRPTRICRTTSFG